MLETDEDTGNVSLARALTFELHLPLAHRIHFHRTEITQVVVLKVVLALDVERGQASGRITSSKGAIRSSWNGKTLVVMSLVVHWLYIMTNEQVGLSITNTPLSTLTFDR